MDIQYISATYILLFGLDYRHFSTLYLVIERGKQLALHMW